MRELHSNEVLQVSGASYGAYGPAMSGAVDQRGNQDGDSFDETAVMAAAVAATAAAAGCKPVAIAAGVIAAAAGLLDTFAT